MPVPIPSVHRVGVGIVGVLRMCVLSLASCSVILDWNGYTGGDAGDEGDDAALDAREAAPPPTCGPDNCTGCCASPTLCAGGFSSGTCGQGGQACSDCASQGLACTNGKCVQPPPDSGPPPACSIVQCKTLISCLGSIEIACCKQDGTCGCEPVLGSSVCM